MGSTSVSGQIKQHDLGIIQSDEIQRARITDRGAIAGRQQVFIWVIPVPADIR